MSIYQESFGGNDFESDIIMPGSDDLPGDWHFGSPSEELAEYRSKFGMHYNWETHLWECRCEHYVKSGRCKHAYRFRRQEDVTGINEDYL